MKKPILTIMTLATVLPELATGSTTLFGFLNIGTLFFLVTGYGLTVLLIREFVVRMKINLFGLFLIGFAYTILNEGLYAKTLIREVGFPIHEFDHYGYMFGITVTGYLTLVLFHSLSSLIFPIVATHVLFPKVKDVPWLSKKVALPLAAIILFLGIAFFTGPQGGVATGSQLSLLLALMAGFTFLGWLLGRRTPTAQPVLPTTLRPFWIGSSTFLFTLIVLSAIVAGSKLPLPIFFAVYLGGVYFYLRMIKKMGVSNDTVLLFSLGAYLTTALFGLLMSLAFGILNPVERLFSETLIMVVAVYFARKVVEKNRKLSNAI